MFFSFELLLALSDMEQSKLRLVEQKKNRVDRKECIIISSIVSLIYLIRRPADSLNGQKHF